MRERWRGRGQIKKESADDVTIHTSSPCTTLGTALCEQTLMVGDYCLAGFMLYSDCISERYMCFLMLCYRAHAIRAAHLPLYSILAYCWSKEVTMPTGNRMKGIHCENGISVSCYLSSNSSRFKPHRVIHVLKPISDHLNWESSSSSISLTFLSCFNNHILKWPAL